jgi:hypothetical protein
MDQLDPVNLWCLISSLRPNGESPSTESVFNDAGLLEDNDGADARVTDMVDTASRATDRALVHLPIKDGGNSESL